MTNISQKDLGQKSLKYLHVQELSEATKRKRLVRCRYLQRPYGYFKVQRMWFSGEKFVTAERLCESAKQTAACS